MKITKRFNEDPYNLSISDLTNQEWDVVVQVKNAQTNLFQLLMENEKEICPDILYNHSSMENLANFCRKFLLAWEFAQQQTDK